MRCVLKTIGCRSAAPPAVARAVPTAAVESASTGLAATIAEAATESGAPNAGSAEPTISAVDSNCRLGSVARASPMRC